MQATGYSSERWRRRFDCRSLRYHTRKISIQTKWLARFKLASYRKERQTELARADTPIASIPVLTPREPS